MLFSIDVHKPRGITINAEEHINNHHQCHRLQCPGREEVGIVNERDSPMFVYEQRKHEERYEEAEEDEIG